MQKQKNTYKKILDAQLPQNNCAIDYALDPEQKCRSPFRSI